MRVISRRRIREFSTINSKAEKPLHIWYKLISKNKFKSFVNLKLFFPSIDLVGKFVVFNIGGNKFRLIAAIHFNTQMVFIRHIFTHADYDKKKWRE